MSAFNGANPKFRDRFRVFTDGTYRRVVTDALIRQLVAAELVRPQPTIEYWLVAGRIASGQAVALSDHFKVNGWTLRDRSWIRQTLALLAGDGYEDDVVTMAAKLLTD